MEQSPRNSASDMSESTAASRRPAAVPSRSASTAARSAARQSMGGYLAAALTGAAAGQPCEDLAATGIAGRVRHAGVAVAAAIPARSRRTVAGAAPCSA